MPLRFTVAPLPLADGLIAPEMLQVGAAAAVKLTPLVLEPFNVTAALAGVKVKPGLLGVTV